MNKSHYPNFETLRVIQLENIHRGISHKREKLQMKMAEDMDRSSYLDILPRNYPILPINRCSIHDVQLLEELHEQCFDCYWTLEKKKAEENGNLEYYYACFKWYSIRDTMTDDEINELFYKIESHFRQRMTTNKIIQCIMEAPNFLEEVV